MEKSKKVHPNLNKRMYIRVALLDYARMINISAEDIDKLYQKMDYLKEHACENEQDLEFAINHNLEDLINKKEALKTKEEQRAFLKQHLEQMKKKIAERIFSYYNIDTADQNEAVLAEILSEAKISKDESKMLAHAVCAKELDAPYTTKRGKDGTLADRLANQIHSVQDKIKSSLAEDFETYTDQRTRSALIEDIRQDILGYTADVEVPPVIMQYSTHPEERARNEKERKIAKQADQNRHDIRDEFKIPRENFVKIIGLMAYNGKCLENADSTQSNYDAFCRHFQKVFGKDKWEATIDTALKISPKTTDPAVRDKERREAYNAISRDLYMKMIIGLLSNKYLYDQGYFDVTAAGAQAKPKNTDYATYLGTINDKFISALMQGKTDIGTLCFAQPNARMSNGDNTAEKQVVSVHHKVPVGSAFDLTDQFFQPNTDKVKNGSDLVNCYGNFSLILGTDLHQSLEALGKCKLQAEQDTTIFATKFSKKILELDLPQNIKKRIAEYLSAEPNDRGIMTIDFPLPESDIIHKARPRARQQAEYVPTTTDKFDRYYDSTLTF